MANLIYAKRIKGIIHSVNKKVLVTRQYLEQLEDDLKRRVSKHAEINGDGYLREIPIEAQLDGAAPREEKTTVPSREQTIVEPSLDDEPEPSLEDADPKPGDGINGCPECGCKIESESAKCPACKCCLVCKEVPCECESLCETCEQEPCICNEPCAVCGKVACECSCPDCGKTSCECEEPEL